MFSVFLIVCIISSTSTSMFQREKRESVGQIFAHLLDSILGETKNMTINNDTLPTTFSLLNTIKSHSTGTSKTPTPSPTSSTSTTTSTNVTLSPSDVTTETHTTPKTVTMTSDSRITLPSSTTETVTLSNNCAAEFSFKEYCGNGLSDILLDLNIWDVYGVMFSNDVIEALLLNCASGHWCLYDEFDYWNGLMMEKAAMVKNSPIFSQICQATSISCFEKILTNVTDCPIEQRMNFTIDAIHLLCGIRKDSTEDGVCYGHILAALHVTVVEFLRDDNNKNLRQESLQGVCNSPEVLMTKSVLCVETKCPNHNNYFLGFSPWKWFTPNFETYKSQCSLPADTCDEDATFGTRETTTLSFYTTEESVSTTSQSTSTTGQGASGVNMVGDNESTMSFSAKMTMVLGIGAGGMIAISGFFVLIYACLRKHGSLRADKVGYTPLRNQD